MREYVCLLGVMYIISDGDRKGEEETVVTRLEITADSVEQAEQQTLEYALIFYPTVDGWYGHEVIAFAKDIIGGG